MLSTVLSLAGAGRCVGCGATGEPLCAACLLGLRPAGPISLPGVDRVAACWEHDGAARALVLGLKLGRRREHATALARGLAGVVRNVGTSASVIAWPPCSGGDRRRRGFDHAELIARDVGRRLGLPATPLLRRVGSASDQAALTGSGRRSNLRGAFAARAAPPAVLLVDDVVTTGSTLQACATALQDAGARRIEAVVACSAFS